MKTIGVDKQDLINLITGCSPSYEQMGDPFCKQTGSFSGSYGRWDWDKRSLEKYSEDALYEVYIWLKNK